MSTLAEQIKVVIAKHRRECVGIKSVELIAIRKGKTDAIRTRGHDLARNQARKVRGQDHFKYSCGMNLYGVEPRAWLLPRNGRLRCARAENSNGQRSLAIALRPMWSENPEGIRVFASRNELELPGERILH